MTFALLRSLSRSRLYKNTDGPLRRLGGLLGQGEAPRRLDAARGLSKSTSTLTSATSIKKKRRKPRVARCIVKYDHSKGKLAVRVTDDVTVRARG